MGKGLLISKRVISIQLSKNNVLQGVASHALIYPIIPSKKNKLIQQQKFFRKPRLQTQGNPTITLTLHSFWHHDGLKFPSCTVLAPKLLPS
jgi:hypothetical protein